MKLRKKKIIISSSVIILLIAIGVMLNYSLSKKITSEPAIHRVEKNFPYHLASVEVEMLDSSGRKYTTEILELKKIDVKPRHAALVPVKKYFSGEIELTDPWGNTYTVKDTETVVFKEVIAE